MSAPTLWEEGHWSGTRVIRLSVLASALAIGLSLLVHGRLGLLFGIAFVAICVAAALLVREQDFFGIGVLPPLLLLGAVVFLAISNRAALSNATDGFAQAIISGLAHQATPLALGYGLTLAILAIRHRVLDRAALHQPMGQPMGVPTRPATQR